MTYAAPFDFASCVPVLDYTTLPPGLLDAVRQWQAKHEQKVRLVDVRRIAREVLGEDCGYKCAKCVLEELGGY